MEDSWDTFMVDSVDDGNGGAEGGSVGGTLGSAVGFSVVVGTRVGSTLGVEPSQRGVRAMGTVVPPTPRRLA